MGHEIMAVSRLAEGHLRKKILSGALCRAELFCGLDADRVSWHAVRRTPCSPVPPQRPFNPSEIPLSPVPVAGKLQASSSTHPGTRQRPGAPRQGFSRAGPLAWAQRNTKRRPLPASRSITCVTNYSHYLVKSNFFLPSAAYNPHFIVQTTPYTTAGRCHGPRPASWLPPCR